MIYDTMKNVFIYQDSSLTASLLHTIPFYYIHVSRGVS